MNEERFYRIGQFAKMIGVCQRTLWRWEKAGILKPARLNGRQRMYTHSQYLEYIGKKDDKEVRRNVIYARVSTRNQNDDMENQKQFVFDYCAEHDLAISEMLADYGSGLNYKRKNWNKLLSDVMDGKINKIIVASEDRFVRFGFDWFQRLCKRFGSEIIVVNKEASTPGKELTRDMASILRVFSCRLHGLRKYKDEMKKDKELGYARNS